MPDAVTGLLLVTVHPERIAPRDPWRGVSLVLAVRPRSGGDAARVVAGRWRSRRPTVDRSICRRARRSRGIRATAARPRACASSRRAPSTSATSASTPRASSAPTRASTSAAPDDRLNLRAQNLRLFLQVADGVDDDTWLHHLRQRDYSRWIREAMKDEDLANDVAGIENASDVAPKLSPNESRTRIRAAVESRYTAAP